MKETAPHKRAASNKGDQLRSSSSRALGEANTPWLPQDPALAGTTSRPNGFSGQNGDTSTRRPSELRLLCSQPWQAWLELTRTLVLPLNEISQACRRPATQPRLQAPAVVLRRSSGLPTLYPPMERPIARPRRSYTLAS
jgi:hypothetical protein